MDRGHRSGKQRPQDGGGARHVSLARALSKLGWCSRAEARPLIESGRVSVDGVTIRDPDHRLEMRRARIAVDGTTLRAAAQVYLMLHKPRGWVATRGDETGRSTVYELLPDDVPRLIAVAPLDVDSEGVQLFTNDTRWADRIADAAGSLDRVYHVRLAGSPDDAKVAALLDGVDAGRGQLLRAREVSRLERRDGHWLEIVLDESRSRPIRRFLDAARIEAEKVVRIAIGSLQLGDLGPGMWRLLTRAEKDALTPGGDAAGEKKVDAAEEGRAGDAASAARPRRRHR